MKKNAISLLLSIVLAAGSIGTAPVYAAETTAEEAVAVEEEESLEKEAYEKIEDADTGLTVSKEETIQADEEEPIEKEKEVEGSTDGQDESADIVGLEETADDEEAENYVEEKKNSVDETESVEPVVIEEEIVTADENEAAEADDVVDSGTCGDNATWTLTGTGDNLILTISGTGKMEDYDDPYVNQDVGYIYPWGNESDLIDTIIIDDGITSIGNYAFCALFSLTSVKIPDSVTSIGDCAFWYCDSLTNVTIPDSVTSIGDSAFMHCECLTTVMIPDSVTSIEWYAFNSCSSLTSVTIGDGVTRIADETFAGCTSLTSVAIGTNVRSISDRAFYECFQVKEIHVKTLETWLKTDFRSSSFGHIGEYDLYINNDLLTNAVIPDGISEITNGAFYGCSSLISVTIPDSMTRIASCAFSNCSNLTTIVIGSGLKQMGEKVFSNCKKFKEIHIKSLESWLNIDESLDTWVFDDGYSSYHQYISYDLYLNDELLTDAIIPDDIIKIRDRAFWNCESLKSVTIPNSVTSIGKSAFFGCSNLSSVMIPDSVTSIGQEAFYGCSSLTSVTILGSVTDIENSAFESCKSLTSIMIPDSVTSIGSMAFYECGDLTSVTIPESVTRIGDSAFEDCNSLTSITIPDSVTYIGDHAFGNHNTNTSVRFRGTEEQWEAIEKTNGWEIIYYRSIVFNCFNVPVECKLLGTSFTYVGKEIRPSVMVSYEGKSLIEGVDYKIVYKNNTKPGTATADVVGTGDYSGIVSLDYDILLGATKKVTCTNVASGIKVSWEKVEGATSYYVYRDDSPWYLFKTSALVVTDKDVKYWNGSKFVYKVVATAKGSGDSPKARTATMYRLMPVGITSLTNPSAGKMTVTYDCCYGGSGYVVRYGLKSDMSDAKVITVKGDSTTSRTFGGMKKGKTYYVQVRTYKIDNGVRYYSGYCTTKKITIKK